VITEPRYQCARLPGDGAARRQRLQLFDCDGSYRRAISGNGTELYQAALGLVSFATGAPSLANAKCREDPIEDVVGGSGSGDGVDGAERPIEIEQQHFVRDFFRYRVARSG